jgi:hypothetical protein
VGLGQMTANSDNLEQVRRDLAQIRRERRAEIRGERRNRFLRTIGHVTRPMVYLVPMALLVWWLWPGENLLSQPLASLTLSDLSIIGGSIVVFSAVAIPLMLFLFNVDGDDIKWEAWGLFGIGLLVVTAGTAFWLVFQ